MPEFAYIMLILYAVAGIGYLVLRWQGRQTRRNFPTDLDDHDAMYPQRWRDYQ